MGKKCINRNSLKFKRKMQISQARALAEPKHRRKKWRKPTKIKVHTGVRKAALRAKCTSLINLLAEPKVGVSAASNEKKCGHGDVSKAALKAKPTQSNINAAFPKLQHVALTIKRHNERLAPRQQKAVENVRQKLIESFKQNHPPGGETNEQLLYGAIVHKSCFEDPKDYPLRYIYQLSMEERKGFLKRMMLLALPKELPPPPDSMRGKKKKLAELKPHFDRLAKPISKKSLTPHESFNVKPEALTALCTDHVKMLAHHREAKPPAPVYDFRGNEILPPRKWRIEERRRVITTERTIQLAIAKHKTVKAVEDEKDDPFKVKPAALKYESSERIKQLAIRPKRRKHCL